jgi:hypothetical protein
MLKRLLWLNVVLLITVLNVNALRPFVFLTQGSQICCLECKKNFCPMKKSGEDVPSCHMSEQRDQAKMDKTCNHSNEEHTFSYSAILISSLFIINYSLENTVTISTQEIELPDFQPDIPPPRI